MIGLRFIFFVILATCLSLSAGLYALTASALFAPGWQPAARPAASQAASARQSAAPPAAATLCELGAGFPQTVRQWCAPIQQYARQHQLAPDLVAALIWLESGGDPQAYSASGAVGLMQVMPRDGKAAAFRCANGPCFHDRPSIAELNDPEFNIAYGTRMLAGLLSRSGDLREALKAYGPMDAGYTYADRVLGIYRRAGQQISQ